MIGRSSSHNFYLEIESSSVTSDCKENINWRIAGAQNIILLKISDGPVKILHRNHILPLGQKVCLVPTQNPDIVPKRRLRRGKKHQNKDIDKGSIRDLEMSDQNNKDDTDSEDEMFYMPFSIHSTSKDDETREPFSLDLDMQPGKQTEDLQAVQEGQNTNKETILDITKQSDLQETCNAETDSQEDLQTDSEIRTSQRQKKVPSRLTYDTPGNPSICPVKFVSCFYKWISSPFPTLVGSI